MHARTKIRSETKVIPIQQAPTPSKTPPGQWVSRALAFTALQNKKNALFPNKHLHPDHDRHLNAVLLLPSHL